MHCVLLGLWLAEAAQALVRNVDFEVPALRRSSAWHQQQVADLQRRREEARTSSATAAATYKKVGVAYDCASMRHHATMFNGISNRPTCSEGAGDLRAHL